MRPLATIEPTAIALGLPVDTTFGVASLAALGQRLTLPRYRDATIVVAWEHKQIVTLARGLIARKGGDPATVPAWSDVDFGSIYVVTLDDGGAHLRIEQQNLGSLPDACPAN